MPLILQDPEDLESEYLLKALLEGCEDAISGGGAFAWATSAGARLLLEHETFVGFAKSGAFDLVVGVDAITNPAALRALADANDRLTGLTSRVFLHNTPGPLFHPKFCWFRKPEGGTLIVGSGNLTLGGLRGNWEALSVSSVSEVEISQIESQWTTWTQKYADLLFSPEDERVRVRAEKNQGWESSAEKISIRGTAPNKSVQPKTRIPAVGPVLVAEIPSAGKIKPRWKQANFDLENYERFFGAKRGTKRQVLLQHVQSDGTPADIESRSSVEVASKNYRIELAAAAGLAYPAEGPPIGVFVRLPTGVFLYRLLMPNDPDYAVVSRFLDDRWAGPGKRKRRVRVDEETLRAAWPDSPLWQAMES